MLAIVCPGQGSQSPGFLAPWLELPGLTDRLQWLSAVAGVDLTAHGTVSDAETIKDTAIAQPLIVGAGLLALAALRAGDAGDPHAAADVVAGHSVGEITAAAVTGVLNDEQAMVFVRERGRGMATASAAAPTGMSALLGGDPAEVESVLARHGLTAANNNGGGQVVAAGTLDQLAALKDDPPAKARVIPLQVAGAFHTQHMSPAVATLEGYARVLEPGDPDTVLLSNKDGMPVGSGREFLDRLVSQVGTPVRWDLCTEELRRMGVTALIELPPAGTLAGLAKRALPGIEILAMKTPSDLDRAQQLLREHASLGRTTQNA